MRVENMVSSRGNKIANQFIVHISGPNVWPDGTKTGSGSFFQSYNSVIVFKEYISLIKPLLCICTILLV